MRKKIIEHKDVVLNDRWFEELINENTNLEEGFVDRFVAKSRNWGFQDKDYLRDGNSER